MTLKLKIIQLFERPETQWDVEVNATTFPINWVDITGMIEMRKSPGYLRNVLEAKSLSHMGKKYR
jgi:hypothetical protein